MEPPAGYRVFVGGISWKADEVQLEKFFSTHGQVLECKIIMDKATGKSKGYGFVTFKDANSAEFVKQTANFSFLGKNMNVGDAVRKASEPNGANYNGSRPHGNYNNGFHQPYYTPNFYNRQADTQYYGQFSPDGSFYPAQFYYPQGYRGPPQYQFNYQSFPPPEGDPSASPGDSTSASPPSFAPSSNYTPFAPNGNGPNFTPYYNNNYYNAYYYPYAAAPGGAYPAGYGYNQGFAPAEGGGGDEGGPVPHSGDHSHHTPPHDALHPQPHDTTVHSTDGTDAVPPTPTPTPTGTALPPSTPTSSAAPDATLPISTTPSTTSNDVTAPPTTAPLPKADGLVATSGSPAQTRTQGGSTRASPKPQHKQQPQQYQQQQPKQKRPKSPALRSASQDPALHNHVIPNFSKLSVSSN